jgi:hypothetical protein
MYLPVFMFFKESGGGGYFINIFDKFADLWKITTI